ncbi:hypothetical protein [Rathayibacter soli]|uniref:hypothetical protein n=1 Tax=Rathayibacter soli TaxID=3144168 RepID=UPI0027E44AD2|nr:hypothetical protein [Glaciibacter superstes]
MFGRRSHRETGDGVRPQRVRRTPEEPAVGIGARVFIKADAGGRDSWDGEPSGVIIAPGDSELIAYPGLNLGGAARWLVAFDELAYMTDGRGPFEQASVPSWQLVLASIADEDITAERGADDA